MELFYIFVLSEQTVCKFNSISRIDHIKISLAKIELDGRTQIIIIISNSE